MRRVFDIVVADIALLFFSPVLLVAMLAIRLESPGSPIYRQRRVGRNGRQFDVFKLRTMVTGAEHIPEESAPGFVRALTAAARRHVCLTAAAPGQVGLCHVNCQPKSYWIRLFAGRGFVFDEALTGRWQRANTEADLATWLCHNLMIFHAPAGRPGPH